MLTADQQEKYFENYLGTNSEYINFAENEDSEKAKAKACSGISLSNRVADDQVDER
jgi:membrane-bound lytic murein transglycosylase